MIDHAKSIHPICDNCHRKIFGTWWDQFGVARSIPDSSKDADKHFCHHGCQMSYMHARNRGEVCEDVRDESKLRMEQAVTDVVTTAKNVISFMKEANDKVEEAMREELQTVEAHRLKYSHAIDEEREKAFATGSTAAARMNDNVQRVADEETTAREAMNTDAENVKSAGTSAIRIIDGVVTDVDREASSYRNAMTSHANDVSAYASEKMDEMNDARRNVTEEALAAKKAIGKAHDDTLELIRKMRESIDSHTIAYERQVSDRMNEPTPRTTYREFTYEGQELIAYLTDGGIHVYGLNPPTGRQVVLPGSETETMPSTDRLRDLMHKFRFIPNPDEKGVDE